MFLIIKILKQTFLILVLVFLFSCGCNLPKDKKTEEFTQEPTYSNPHLQDSITTFLIYGELAPDGYLDTEDSITYRYGFRLKRVAGCEISSLEINKIHQHNQQAITKMNKKFGLNWIDEFEKSTNHKLMIPN